MSINEKKDAIQAHAEGLIKRGKDKLDQVRVARDLPRRPISIV